MVLGMKNKEKISKPLKTIIMHLIFIKLETILLN